MSDYEIGDRQLSRIMLARESAESDQHTHASPSAIQTDPVDQVACRVGDASCATAHASTLSRSARSEALTEKSLLRLQRQYGNYYVGQVLSRARAGDERGDGLESVERSIDQARSGGQGLDHGVRSQMESSFGADFGGVRVHTDANADSLNRALSARAFTTGQDVFFRQGEYNPGSSTGRELLAHELTHVVQQNGDGIQRKMTVSQPGDPHELEADRMAKAVIQQEQQLAPNADRQVLSRQEEEEKETATKLDRAIQRQPEAVTEQDEEKKKRLSGQI